MAKRHGTPTTQEHENRKFTSNHQVKTTGLASPRIVNTFDGSQNLTRSDEYKGRREITEVQFVADTGGSLNNKYWTFYSALDATQYYVWYNVASGGVDPTPGGTGIEVAIGTGDSAEAIKDATVTAILAQVSDDARAKSIGTSKLELANQDYGVCTAVSDGNTGFTFTQIDAGSDWVLITSTLITYDGNGNPTEIIRIEH